MKVFALFGRPESLRRFHGCAAIMWAVMTVPSVMWWSQSVPYLVMLSVYSVVTGHWSSYAAARVEVKQEQMIEETA